MDWELEKDEELDTPNISEKRIKRQIYMEFLTDFKETMIDFVNESVNQLCITEIPVRGTVRLFDGNSHGPVKIKNQGQTICYLSTNGQGGFQLAPFESVEFFVNNAVYVTTISGGSTKVGFIRS